MEFGRFRRKYNAYFKIWRGGSQDRSGGFGIMKSLTLDEFNFTFIKDFEAF